MKKTIRRKSLSRVFSKFIRLGLYDPRLTPRDVCVRIWGGCSGEERAKDVFALWELWRLMKAEGRAEELGLFTDIYAPKGRISGADVELRVLKYARENYCDVRTVYRRLDTLERRYWLFSDSLD